MSLAQRLDPVPLAVILAGLVARTVFWATTDRQFEDGLITTIHARNAVEGLGLTHHIGEGHIHGFTSPISVLVPLVGELVHSGAGFFALRFTSLVAFVVASFFAWRLCQLFEVGRWPAAFVLCFLAFDRNHLFYGMAGMETEIAVAVLLGSMYVTIRRHAVWAGITFGLCALTRPDFLLWVVIGAAFLATVGRRQVILALACALAVTGPWVVFATAYYGSPVPHTIAAKSHELFDPPSLRHPGAFLPWGRDQLIGHRGSWVGVSPFLEDGQVVDTPVPHVLLKLIAYTLLLLALLGACARGRRGPPLWPIAVYVSGFLLYLLFVLPATYFQWYQPPVTACLALLAAIGMAAIGRRSAAAPKVASAFLALAFAAPLVWVFPMEARIQHIENHVRKQMGQWLYDHVPTGESLTSESSGYVGYYGRVKLYDWPGLTSKASFDAVKNLPPIDDQFLTVIRVLRPDWIVMRPPEVRLFRSTYPQLAGTYHIVKAFQADPPVGLPLPSRYPAYGPGVFALRQWGMIERNIDEQFVVLRRIQLGPVRRVADPTTSRT